MPYCTLRLIQHFSKNKNFNVSVIFPEDGEFVHSCRKFDAKVYIIPFQRLRSLKHMQDFFCFFLKLPVALLKVYHRFASLKPDIIHFSDFIDAPFYPCASFCGASVIVHLRTCLSNSILILFYKWWRFLFADKTVFISKEVKRCVGGLNDEKDVIYDPGPQEEIFFSKNREFPQDQIHQYPITLISISSIHANKGQLNILKMAAELEQTNPGRFRYILIGKAKPGHEWYLTELTKFIVNNELKQIITFTGHLNRKVIAQKIRNADIFIHLPVYQEGLGLVVLEAMISGLPVVAFSSGGIGECFSNGIEGILVPHGNIKAAADAVTILARNSRLRQVMGQAGPKRVRKQFAAEIHFRKIEYLYENLIKVKAKSLYSHK